MGWSEGLPSPERRRVRISATSRLRYRRPGAGGEEDVVGAAAEGVEAAVGAVGAVGADGAGVEAAGAAGAAVGAVVAAVGVGMQGSEEDGHDPSFC